MCGRCALYAIETKYRAKWELFTPLLIQITDLRATLFAT